MLETIRADWRDFVIPEQLCRRAGASMELLVLVAVKELIDNASDASPAGVEVDVIDRSVIVTDKGPGLAEEQICSIFAINRQSFSSKRWRLARRGALGNGTRAVTGIAYISGGDILVESRGVALRLSIDPDGNTKIINRMPSSVTAGTAITLTVGSKLEFSAGDVREYAELCLAAPGTAYGGTKAVPEWFGADDLRELARDMPPGTSVLEYARNFDVTDAALAKIKALALRKSTYDLVDNSELMVSVASCLFAGSKGARALKRIGRNARSGSYAFEEGHFRLSRVSIPCIVEVWVDGYSVDGKKTDGEVNVNAIFANRTPALMTSSWGNVQAASKAFTLYLGNSGAIRLDGVLKGPCDFEIELAITAPELPIVSDGKSIDMKPFRELIASALSKSLPKAYVSPRKSDTPQTEKPSSIKGAIYELIEGAYNEISAAGIGVPPRMLMYKMRPAILAMTGRASFDYGTFVNAVHDFLEDFPELTENWQFNYDNRGHFFEPGGATLGLGTQAVDQFVASLSRQPADFIPLIEGCDLDLRAGIMREGDDPSHRFSAIVFIEKEGYTEMILKSGIARRFDVAFASTKGLPNTAIRKLLDAVAAYGVKVFCLHDFDIAGLTIANTLATSNRRYQFENKLDFVDMGIRLLDAVEMGLDTERLASILRTLLEVRVVDHGPRRCLTIARQDASDRRGWTRDREPAPR